MNDQIERSSELELTRSLLRDIEPPSGAKQRVEQALLLQTQRGRARTSWRWGFALAFLAATSAAAVSDWIPVRRLFQLTPTLDSTTPAQVSEPARRHAKVAAPTPTPPSDVTSSLAASDIDPSTLGKSEAAEAPATAGRRIVASKHRQTATAIDQEPVDSAPTPSELSLMVAEFEQAKALAARDPQAGLAAFRRLQQRWPQSPLRPEVDLQVVSLLNRMGKHHESEAEADSFLHKHPDSPRAKELRKALGE